MKKASDILRMARNNSLAVFCIVIVIFSVNCFENWQKRGSFIDDSSIAPAFIVGGASLSFFIVISLLLKIYKRR